VRIRAVTWNAHGGLPAKSGQRSFADSLYTLNKLEPDLVALQELEVDPSSGRFAGPSTDIVVATDLKYVAAFAPSPSHHTEGRALAVALASRWPLESIRRILLPNPHLKFENEEWGSVTTHDKGLVLADVRIDAGFLTSGSLHTYPFRRFGRNAREPAFAPVWSALANEIDQLAGVPLILGGDFNTEDRGLLFGPLRRTGLRSAAGSVQSRPGGECYDDITYTVPIHPVASYAEKTFSDHHMVIVDFNTETVSENA
jgi:endonuclease/exonuclease/phosphatase family metal-dependent hydrolase